MVHSCKAIPRRLCSPRRSGDESYLLTVISRATEDAITLGRDGQPPSLLDLQSYRKAISEMPA